MRVRLLAVLLAALLALWFSPTPAHADADCGADGLCGVGSGGGGSGGGGGGGSPDYPKCSAFPNALNDILEVLEQDNPDDWVEVHCRQAGAVLTVWVEARINAEQLAWSLLAQMQLRPIDIGMVPREGANYVGTVGAPVWMWVDGPSAVTWGPKSISAGGISMTARVTKLVWNMGDGGKVTCGRGTEWTTGDGLKKSPDCGYVYDKRGTYTITATSHWRAHWTGYGQSGDFYFQLTRSRSLQVTEIQVVVTQGK